MNAISRMSSTNDYSDSASSAEQTHRLAMGLGPNQLNWLRSNIGAFKHAEDQRVQLWHDAVRAARIAGLV